MTRTFHIVLVAFALTLSLPMLAGHRAMADDRSNKGGNHSSNGKDADKGRSQSQSQGRGHEGGRSEGPGGGPYISAERNFRDVDRRTIHDYYEHNVQRGHCPPGLAKKNNGCVPPGHAKKWSIGQRLPSNVIFHPIPQDILIRVAPPPRGYRYVRVDFDILMISTGIGMVVAAIENMGLL